MSIRGCVRVCRSGYRVWANSLIKIVVLIVCALVQPSALISQEPGFREFSSALPLGSPFPQIYPASQTVNLVQPLSRAPQYLASSTPGIAGASSAGDLKCEGTKPCLAPVEHGEILCSGPLMHQSWNRETATGCVRSVEKRDPSANLKLRGGTDNVEMAIERVPEAFPEWKEFGYEGSPEDGFEVDSDDENIMADDTDDRTVDQNLAVQSELEKLPTQIREEFKELLENTVQAEDDIPIEVKYAKILDGSVNETTVNETMIPDTGGVIGIQATLEELARIRREMEYSGVSPGLNFSCTAPHHTCVVTSVAPFLAAWHQKVSPGDIILSINDENITDIVTSVIREYNQSVEAKAKSSESFGVAWDVAKKTGRGYNASALDGLIQNSIKMKLCGGEGTTVCIKIQRTFKYIQTCKGERVKRHPKYDGHPVYRSLELKREAKETLPPNWDRHLEYDIVNIEKHHLIAESEELLSAGAISKEEHHKMQQWVPRHLGTENENFQQIFPVYFNNRTGIVLSTKPEKDSIAPETSEEIQRMTEEFWNATLHLETDKLAKLAQDGADIDWRNSDWLLAAPIHKASESGNVALVDKLISLGANHSVTNLFGWNALHYACFSQNAAIVKKLLAKGLDPNSRTNTRTTPLHYCAMKGNYRAMELLLKAGANKDVRDVRDISPAELALHLQPERRKGEDADAKRRCLEVLKPFPDGTRTSEQMEEAGYLIPA